MRALAVAIVLGAVLAVPATAAGQSPQVIRFDGGGYDRAAGIATDAVGNTYVTGSAEARGGGPAFAVVKIGSDGRQRWATRYNGSRGGVLGSARAVAVDAAGNVYAAGHISDGAVFGQNFDYLVVKFGPDGTQRWAYRYEGPGRSTDIASGIAVDAAGNAYVTGSSYSQSLDWATLKLSTDGALIWERRLSGPDFSSDGAAGLALLPNGNLVVAGATQNTSAAQTDAETVAYDPQGTIVWRARFTETAESHELVADLDVDAAGRIAITGTSAATASDYEVPAPLTLRYDQDGKLLQTIRGDGGSSVDVDPAGNVYLAGLSERVGDPFLAKYDAAGNRVWVTPLRGGASEFLANPQVVADANGTVTVGATFGDATERGYLTIRVAPDGRERFRHAFDGARDDPGQHDQFAGVAIDSNGAAHVTGTSWNGYGSQGGTAMDIVTLKFAPGATAPALVAPSQLAATALSTSQIRLTWQDNAGTEDGYQIERCAGTGCTSFSLVATVGRNVSSYADAGLERNADYRYRVRAFDSGGTSAYSNTAAAKTRRR